MTCNTFAIRFPQKQKLSSTTAKKIIENFESVTARVQKNNNKEIIMLEYFAAYPRLSIGKLC